MTSPEKVPYAELQEQAKLAGIPANQSRADLEAALAPDVPPADEAEQVQVDVQAALAQAVDDLELTFSASGEKSSEGDGVTAADLEAAQGGGVDPIAAAYAAALAEAEAAADAEAAPEATETAGPELFELAEGEEITGERDLGDGTRNVVTSYGRKARLEGDVIIEKLVGFGGNPGHDNPAPQPGTPEHDAAYA